ncbi:hypothetical protein [Rothia sp. 32237D007AR]
MATHRLKVSLTKSAPDDALLSTKRLTLRERILTVLLGPKQDLTVLIPGNQVKTVEIVQPEDDLMALADAVLAHPAGKGRKEEVAA